MNSRNDNEQVDILKMLLEESVNIDTVDAESKRGAPRCI
jgi:hypothetical protein